MRQRQLAASANRLIGSSFAFGDRYVVVNIPGGGRRGGGSRRRGAPLRRRGGQARPPLPAVETRITNINFNPTWTVPVSLIKKDIIPHMRKDPGYLAKMHIRMLDGQGQEVQPTAVDWSTERAVNYTLRQDPGFDNSLGQVRIDMPNRHAVYMHDTPSKGLFSRDVRFHSSGCVRVADVKALVGCLLEGTPGPNGTGSTWGPMEIETGIATGERRDIKLAKPIPVTFVYLTATPPRTAGCISRRRLRPRHRQAGGAGGDRGARQAGRAAPAKAGAVKGGDKAGDSKAGDSKAGATDATPGRSAPAKPDDAGRAARAKAAPKPAARGIRLPRHRARRRPRRPSGAPFPRPDPGARWPEGRGGEAFLSPLRRVRRASPGQPHAVLPIESVVAALN